MGGRVVINALAGIPLAGPSRGFSIAHTSNAGVVLHTLFLQPPAPAPLRVTLRQAGVRDRVYGQLVTVQPLVNSAGYAATAKGDGVVVWSSIPGNTVGPNSFALALVNTHADTVWARRLSYSARAVTDADFRTLLDSLATPETYKGATFAADRRMLLDSIVKARVWPPVTGVATGIDGSIWLRQGGPPTPRALYWRLSASGAITGSVAMPAGFHPLRFSTTLVWGWRANSDGVPIVERYSIR